MAECSNNRSIRVAQAGLRRLGGVGTIEGRSLSISKCIELTEAITEIPGIEDPEYSPLLWKFSVSSQTLNPTCPFASKFLWLDSSVGLVRVVARGLGAGEAK